MKEKQNAPEACALTRVGRQAIFDRQLQVHAYELLYRRSTEDQTAVFTDGNMASSRTILDTFLDLGIERIAGPHRVFINLTRAFFTDLPPIPLDRRRIVLELLEDIEVDDLLISAVKTLHEQGYKLALDDFQFEDKWSPILPYVSVIKVEVKADNLEEIASRVPALRRYDARLLAEKVETREQYDHLHELGFDLFQGFFFARPNVVEGRRLSENQSVVMQLVSLVNDPYVTVGELCEVIVQDPALSYKILRAINSARLNVGRKIGSIHEAVVYLGLDRIRAWATLFALSGFDDKPIEVLNLGLVRANLCERISRITGSGGADECYTVGLLSILDALLDQPMETLLADLPLPQAFSDAIVHHAGPHGRALACALAMEQGRWDSAACMIADGDVLREAFMESTAAAFGILEELEASATPN
jgi:EAL and modified HD-GYP domain-containing signal transduction protein